MQIIDAQAQCPRPANGTVVTIGAYDGVHVGHRAVIEQVLRLAGAQGLASALVTFDRHPASVVRPESAPPLLTDLDQKLELLAGLGLDYTLVIRFDEARAAESAEHFVTEVLADCLNARAVIVGSDFHFGRHRRGNVALLEAMGADLGFEVAGIDLVGSDALPGSDEPVSSTRIRAALVAGDLTTATALLGRAYELRGTVVRGDGRGGAELGFPTANVSVPHERCLPADGIYAGWYQRPDGTVHPAALSLGRRPTYYDDQPFSLLEAHLLDFSGDLYGEKARVRFVERLRDELRFSSVEELIEQIRRDCDSARRVLTSS